MSADKESETETSEITPSQQNKDPSRETPAIPTNLEELKALLGEEGLPAKERELDWLLTWTQEMVKKKGEDGVKKNRAGLLRQWQYYRTLL